MLEKLKEVNRNRSTEITAKVLIVLTILYLLSIFCVYFQTKLNLTNPLIPKYLITGIFDPYATKGIILTIGLLVATILQFFKQNLITILVCVIALTLYYITTFEANFA